MIRTIPAASRHFQDHGWLKTFWLFSFDSYFDPENVQFGALRVFNDDKVSPGQGFDMHRHREMEIISIILAGAITHRDSIGNSEKVKTGEVQVMSAGTGIMHSEYNLENKELHLYQIWISPNKSGLTPSYYQRGFSKADKANRLLPVASGESQGVALFISANATVYLGNLEKGKRIEHSAEGKTKCFIYMTGGNLDVNGTSISAGDQARIKNEDILTLEAKVNSDFVLIDLY